MYMTEGQQSYLRVRLGIEPTGTIAETIVRLIMAADAGNKSELERLRILYPDIIEAHEAAKKGLMDLGELVGFENPLFIQYRDAVDGQGAGIGGRG